MELDDLITFILLFVFFVIPSLLKRLKGKAAKKAADQNPAEDGKKKPGLLDKLGTVVQDFVRELEKQALEAKKAAGKSGPSEPDEKGTESSVWDLLDDRETLDAGPALSEPVPAAASSARQEADRDYSDTGRRSYDPDRPFVRPEKKGAVAAPRERGREQRKKAGSVSHLATEPCQPEGVRASIPAHALQQAVVWSEILGPPKALRKD